MIKLPNIKRRHNNVLIEEGLERPEFPVENLSKQMSKLNESIMNLCSLFAAQNHRVANMNESTLNQNEEEIQQRYRGVNLKVEVIGPHQDRSHKIKLFLVQLVNTVASKGFYYFEKHILNEEKFRFFCCRNILYKLVEFAKANQLSMEELELMDSHLQERVLPFAKANYPKSEVKGTNLKLAKMVGDLNNMSSNVNDLVYRSGIKFRKKQSGDYTPEILSFINYLLELTKEKGQNNQQTLFAMFYRDMDDYFNKVQSEYWMRNAQTGNFTTTPEMEDHYYASLGEVEKRIKEREKYKEKVKQYTKYAIGKKIPENIKKYTEEEINEQIPELEHPAIMRIITKWIEQLQELFETKQSIMNREEMFRMRDGTENYMPYSERYLLQQFLTSQKKNLDRFIEGVKKNNSMNWHKTLRENGSRVFKEFVQDQESECGYFSTLINKCYSNYLINYLNKLIDCILAAESEWAVTSNRLQQNEATIPTLVTFRVGDLLRCKCSSKENQIISLFGYLKHLSNQKNQMEIIRVKNRLNQGTKDILINIRYRNQILIEMQLSIDGDKSYFIECSEKANHFLYELERANFGPIAEICNLWLNSSPQSAVLKNAFQQNNQRRPARPLIECSHSLDIENLPFRCSVCAQFCSSLAHVTPHRKCKICQLFICSKCSVEMGREENIPQPKVSREQVEKSLSRNMFMCEVLAIDLNKKKVSEKKYTIAQIKNKEFIFEISGDGESRQIRLIKQPKSKKELISYFQNKLVIELRQNYLQQQLYESLQREVFGQYIKNTQKNSKKMFSNEQSHFYIDIIKNQYMASVERVNFYGNNMVELSLLPSIFRQCKIAYLNNNNISTVSGVEEWRSLEALYLDENSLSSFPKELAELTSLKLLNLSRNSIREIDPGLKPMPKLQSLYLEMNLIKEIDGLVENCQKLKICYLNTNKIAVIPPRIGQLRDLVHLDLGNNQISEIPVEIGAIENLQILAIGHNKIEHLPANLFEKLQRLKELWVYGNMIRAIPKSIRECHKLQKLYAEDNKLSEWPEVFNIKVLKVITISNNTELKHLPRQVNELQNLEQLWAQNIGLEELPFHMGRLSKLQVLILSRNNLKEYPATFNNYKKLREFYIDDSQVTRMLGYLVHMDALEKLSMRNCPITQTPSWISFIKNLTYLNIYSRTLTKLHSDILASSSLKVLRICTQNLDEQSKMVLAELRKNVVVLQAPENSQEEEEPIKIEEHKAGTDKPKIKRRISVSNVDMLRQYEPNDSGAV